MDKIFNAPENALIPHIPPCRPVLFEERDQGGTKRMRDAQVPGYAKVIKSITDKDYMQSQETRWVRALSLWVSIHEGCDMVTSVGAHMYSLLVEGRRMEALEIIRDACGTGSPKTVLKRALDLARYIKWVNGRGESWWPLDERQLNYVAWATESGKSLTTGKDLAFGVVLQVCHGSPRRH